MNGRMDKKRRIFASIFLLGYLSFILVSITHFHHFDSLNPDKTVLSSEISVSKTLTNSEDNCPVCHLYSSVIICSLRQTVSNLQTVESPVATVNEAGYQTEFFSSLSLRAPPSLV